MQSRFYAVRGAVCCENESEDIVKNVSLMMNQIFSLNNIQSQDLVSIQFSMTSDLNEINAATALRKGNIIIDVSKVALFCTQEAQIKNMPPKIIHAMVTFYGDENLSVKNVYLNGAEKLRPDFIKG